MYAKGCFSFLGQYFCKPRPNLAKPHADTAHVTIFGKFAQFAILIKQRSCILGDL